MARNSMFTASPFRGGYSQSVIPAHTLGRRLGQDWRDIVGGLVGELIGEDDFSLSDLEGLLGNFDELLADMPVGALKDSYQKQRDECLAKDNPYNRYKCLYDLAQEIKTALKNGDGKAPAPTGNGQQPPRQPESEFPWIPVGIAAGVGLAALIYLIARPKTPANGKKK